MVNAIGVDGIYQGPTGGGLAGGAAKLDTAGHPSTRNRERKGKRVSEMCGVQVCRVPHGIKGLEEEM